MPLIQSSASPAATATCAERRIVRSPIMAPAHPKDAPPYLRWKAVGIARLDDTAWEPLGSDAAVHRAAPPAPGGGGGGPPGLRGAAPPAPPPPPPPPPPPGPRDPATAPAVIASI